jgi:hypothetical protein
LPSGLGGCWCGDRRGSGRIARAADAHHQQGDSNEEHERATANRGESDVVGQKAVLGMAPQIGASVSIRAPREPDGPLKFGMAKNFDHSCSLGPCIVVGEVGQQEVDVETRVNGVVRQSYNTSEMIWHFGEVLEYLNEVQGLLADIVSKHGGTVDKFMGDGILASFGAVIPDQQHAANALNAVDAKGRVSIPAFLRGVIERRGDALTARLGGARAQIAQAVREGIDVDAQHACDGTGVKRHLITPCEERQSRRLARCGNTETANSTLRIA